MSKTIETDLRTFVKFWLVPVWGHKELDTTKQLHFHGTSESTTDVTTSMIRVSFNFALCILSLFSLQILAVKLYLVC